MKSYHAGDSRNSREEFERCMRAIGVACPIPDGAEWPVFEDDYLKFMGGPNFDTAACDGFEAWLREGGYSYERHRGRAVRHIDPRAADRIYVLWRLTKPLSDNELVTEESFRLPLDWDLYADADGDWWLQPDPETTIFSVPGEALLIGRCSLAVAMRDSLAVLTTVS